MPPKSAHAQLELYPHICHTNVVATLRFFEPLSRKRKETKSCFIMSITNVNANASLPTNRLMYSIIRFELIPLPVCLLSLRSYLNVYSSQVFEKNLNEYAPLHQWRYNACLSKLSPLVWFFGLVRFEPRCAIHTS